jgi:PAS domain-containing protein
VTVEDFARSTTRPLEFGRGASAMDEGSRLDRISPVSEPEEQPLELILARNLVSIISLAAFLVDVEGAIVFYNEAAAEVIGTRFEETGRIARTEWTAKLGPLDEHGRPVPFDQRPVTIALREGHLGYGRFIIRGERGLVETVAAALPLVGPAGNHGALVVFWPLPRAEEG